MTGLDLRLLGGFAVADANGGTIRLSTRKAEALLALLALPVGSSQARDRVCALLWPEVPDTQARHSLRQTLFHMRKALAPAPAALASDARSLQLVAEHVRVDAAHFEACVARGTREALVEAWRCYRGDLLEGVAVDEAPFEHWLRCERERLRQLFSEALTRLVAIDSEEARYTEAIHACTRLLQLEPLREEAHRSMMRLLVQQGRRAAALQHYRDLARMLREELDAEPDHLTQQLHAEIERASSPPPAAAAPSSVASASQQAAPATTGRA
ncbi:MAG TPA: BTAD domain-containing putative transcriptional regulator, partial [Polyangiales bacterium]|nr:BTAD domain-containing putative transcriptional regulator [Polyangiales bacterium]